MLEPLPPREQLRDIWRLVLGLSGLTLLMLGVAAALGHAAWAAAAIIQQPARPLAGDPL